MASKFYFAAPLLVALCFLTLTPADPTPTFTIQGRVYCDTCRAGFETSATEYIDGAKVRLQCRDYSNDTITQTIEGLTDSTGTYELTVEDDHQEEICEVLLLQSPLMGCSEKKEGRDRARVLLTKENGIQSNVRYANALGFLKEEPLSLCGQLLQQYALGNED